MKQLLQKVHWKTLSRLAGVVVALASLAATASVKPNPFEGIPKRNVFNLRPPAPLKEIVPDPPPRKPLPKITVTGLVEMRGGPKALLEITEAGKPVQKPIMAAGGVFDLLEILQIDVAGGRVRVRLDGTEDVLVIEKPKASSGPPPPPPPNPPRPGFAVRG